MRTSSPDMLTMTVGEIMARHPRAAAIMGAHRIDVCRFAHLALPAAVKIAAAHLGDVQRDLSWVLSTPLNPAAPASGRAASEQSVVGAGTSRR